jgi:RNA-directed DNA polymerase
VITVAKAMDHLHKLAGVNRAERLPRLWEKITSEAWLAQAWEEIRSNQGRQTPGIAKRTAKALDLDRIGPLRTRLHEETDRPQAVRRVYIPQRNGTLRPLGSPICPAYCIS